MSNKKSDKVGMRFDFPPDVAEKLKEVSEGTNFPMNLIIVMLVRYYLKSPLDIEHDVRRMLANLAKKNHNVLRLSPRQKKVIADATADIISDELI